MFRKREKGFTLIELLAVVAILGVLSGLAVPRVVGALENARRSRNVANAAILQSAVDRYFVDRGTYPLGTVAGTDLPLPTDATAIVIDGPKLADYLQRGIPPVVAARMVDAVLTPPAPAVDVVTGQRWGLNRRGVVVIMHAETTAVIWTPSP